MEANVQNNLFVFRGITQRDVGYDSKCCSQKLNSLENESTFKDAKVAKKANTQKIFPGCSRTLDLHIHTHTYTHLKDY